MAPSRRRRAAGDTAASSPADLGLDQFAHPPDDAGLSLEDLGRALADTMDRGELPYRDETSEPHSAPADEPPAVAEAIEALVAQDPYDERCEVSPRSILEAILFTGHPHNEPLTSAQVAGLMRGVRPAEIDELVRELNDIYVAEGTAFHVVSEGAGYRLALRDDFRGLRERFYGKVKDARLSQAAIDVLSIVAFNQPLPQEEVDHLRGKPSGGLLAQLVRRQLLRVERTTDKPRRTLYRTTERFLQLFNLNSLDDLPRPQELD